MRLHSILSSSAVLAALCSVMMMGGCGDGTQLDDGSDPALRDGELSSGAGQGQGTKITICHVPPGNPANAHTIVVGGPAWNGHKNHPGDYQGACGGGGGEPDGGTTEPDAGTPPPPPPPDAGTPVCAPEGGACSATVVCCSGLGCNDGVCEPILQ
jgi:hypothetical protein